MQVRGLLKYSRALAPGAEAPPLCALNPAHVAFLIPRMADARAAALAALDGAAPGAGLPETGLPCSVEVCVLLIACLWEGARGAAADMLRSKRAGALGAGDATCLAHSGSAPCC